MRAPKSLTPSNQAHQWSLGAKSECCELHLSFVSFSVDTQVIALTISSR
ncbi:Uncharacterised protein [Vibrio cholerae]|nr:Uncharacterised protein [Vibrio cholerae]